MAIGDACRPHLPHHGQGAASVAEDAASLGVFLSEAVTPSGVPTLLRQWESFRLPRAKAMQLITITFPMPIEELQSQIRTFYDGPLPENVDGHEKAVTRWFYSYDVVAEANEYCRIAQI